MKIRIPILVLAVMVGAGGLTFATGRLVSQSQAPNGLSPDQVEQVHSHLFGSSTHTMVNGKPIGEIPLRLAKTSGDIYLEDSPGHLFSVGEGANMGGDPRARLESWVCESDLVVVGRAGTGTSHMTADKSFLYTDWGVLVEQVLEENSQASVKPGASIVIVRPGGRLKVGDRTVYAVETTYRDFSAGEQYLLFLKFIPATGAYTSADHIYIVSSSKTIPLFHHDFREVEALDKNTLLQLVKDGATASVQDPSCKAGVQK